MENTEMNQNQEDNKVMQWSDVRLDGNMPLNVLVDFLNVVNQRLVAIENQTYVKVDGDKTLSLTEIYRLQSEAQMQQTTMENTENNNKGE